MKQGNAKTKRFGLVALLSAMIAGLSSKPDKTDIPTLQRQKTMLLTNGGMAPIPHKLPNQRQRRKLAAQTR